MTNFTWVEYFKEFSIELLKYKNRGNELIQKVENAFSLAQDIDPKINSSITFDKIKKYNIEPNDVDPITVMGIINRNMTEEKRKTLSEAFKQEFDLQADIPQDFNAIPVLDARQGWIIAKHNDVWDLMEVGLAYADNPTENNRLRFIKEYDRARDSKTSMAYITFGLFWSRPYFFVSIDSRNRWYLREIAPNIADTLTNNHPSAEVYLNICDSLKKYYETSSSIKNHLDFSYAAWVYSQPYIFQCNPKYYDIKGALENLDKIGYRVKPQHRDKVKEGARVYIWMSGADGGIIAKAKVISSVDYHNDPEGDKYYIDISQNNEKNESVWIQFTDKRVNNIISRNEIINHPVLKDLNILKMAQGTNFPISLEQAKAIDDIFSGDYMPDNTNLINEDNAINEDKVDYENKGEYEYHSDVTIGENRVIYGTPGCGKSYYLEKQILENYEKNNWIRTTFYQDYTNTDFIGQVLPRVEDDKVYYEFNPGPFTIALEKAIRNPNQPVALIIEELNRGNAASIFSDIFQLLDREIDGDYVGRSMYPITNINIQDYLNKRFSDKSFSSVRIPSNLSIFATMNTSDQNVFTLDTAFKRRWKFKKLSNRFKDHPYADYYVPGMGETTWKEFVESINKYIVGSTGILMAEDKQIGVFFITKNVLKESVEVENEEDLIKEFSYKILEYLWDDVAKYNRDEWFNNCGTLDELLDKYLELGAEGRGKEVFSEGIFN